MANLHAGGPYPGHLPQFLPALGALGVLGAAPGGGCLGMDGGVFTFHDLAPSEESFRDAVLSGLAQEPKTLPCKFFYDARGSALFEEICLLPEYYLTRTEIAILEQSAGEIAAHIGAHCRLVELGSGASIKGRILLHALEAPAAYLPVDISRGLLRDAATPIAQDFPRVPSIPGCAHYTWP